MNTNLPPTALNEAISETSKAMANVKPNHDTHVPSSNVCIVSSISSVPTHPQPPPPMPAPVPPISSYPSTVTSSSPFVFDPVVKLSHVSSTDLDYFPPFAELDKNVIAELSVEIRKELALIYKMKRAREGGSNQSKSQNIHHNQTHAGETLNPPRKGVGLSVTATTATTSAASKLSFLAHPPASHQTPPTRSNLSAHPLRPQSHSTLASSSTSSFSRLPSVPSSSRDPVSDEFEWSQIDPTVLAELPKSIQTELEAEARRKKKAKVVTLITANGNGKKRKDAHTTNAVKVMNIAEHFRQMAKRQKRENHVLQATLNSSTHTSASASASSIPSSSVQPQPFSRELAFSSSKPISARVDNTSNTVARSIHSKGFTRVDPRIHPDRYTAPTEATTSSNKQFIQQISMDDRLYRYGQDHDQKVYSPNNPHPCVDDVSSTHISPSKPALTSRAVVDGDSLPVNGAPPSPIVLLTPADESDSTSHIDRASVIRTLSDDEVRPMEIDSESNLSTQITTTTRRLQHENEVSNYEASSVKPIELIEVTRSALQLYPDPYPATDHSASNLAEAAPSAESHRSSSPSSIDGSDTIQFEHFSEVESTFHRWLLSRMVPPTAADVDTIRDACLSQLIHHRNLEFVQSMLTHLRRVASGEWNLLTQQQQLDGINWQTPFNQIVEAVQDEVKKCMGASLAIQTFTIK